MNAVTKIEPCAGAVAVILSAREEFGTGNPVSEGAVALATWLEDHRYHEKRQALILALGGASSVRRMVADAITPGLEFSELLGHFTNGTVISRQWLQPYAGDLGPILDVEQAVTSETVERLGAVSAAVPSLGALGTVPPGRLFRFVPVEDEPSMRQIVGLGLAVELGEAALCALRDAAIAAVADIRGGAEA